MTGQYDVVIAGGGLVGQVLACALGGSDLTIALIDPAGVPDATDDYDLRVSAITPAVQTVFERLGVWSSIQNRRLSPVETMRVWDQDAVIEFDSADIGEPCLAWIIENRVMVRALAERAAVHPNIDVLRGTRVTGVEFEDTTVSVQLSSGRTFGARLVVGADGAESPVRKNANLHWSVHDLTQTAIVATIRTERPHGHCAFQRFLPTGPLALLPLAEPDLMSIVWSADNPRSTGLQALNDAEFSSELQGEFGDQLGAIRLVSGRVAFPLALGFAERYTGHRVALIGDAAHTVHPLAGQGANLGVIDAAVLAEELLDANPRLHDAGQAAPLRRYERRRKAPDLTMQLVTGGFRYLFANRHPALQWVRRTGLTLSGQIPLLRNFFMRRASGLDGDLPALARRVLR